MHRSRYSYQIGLVFLYFDPHILGRDPLQQIAPRHARHGLLI